MRLGCIAVVGFALAMAGPAGAKPSRPASGSVGSCAVNPNPVTVGASWTLSGSHLGGSALVNVMVTDAAGSVTSWNLQADTSGAISSTWHSYAAGTSNVKILEGGRHGSTVVAACSFVVT
jgi:hypothetical protein